MSWSALIVAPIVGLAVWFVQSRIEELRRERAGLRDERRELYKEFLEPFIRAFAGSQDEKEADKAIKLMTSAEYRRIAFDLNLIAPDDVVRAFNEMMQFLYHMGQLPEDERLEFIRLWGKPLLEIRKSLGQASTGLSERDMLRGQIKDADALFS